MILKKHRLKIVEQIIIVLLFSVIVPMLISWIIINNINQHAIRKVLQNSSIISAKTIKSSMDALSRSNLRKLDEIVAAFEYIKNKQDRYMYLNNIRLNNPNYKALKLLYPEDAEYSKMKTDVLNYDSKENVIKISKKVKNEDVYVAASIDVTEFENDLFSFLKDDHRQAYILDAKREVLFSHNFNEEDLRQTINSLPQKIEPMQPVIFGYSKNQPLVYYKLEQPDIMIIVDTTEEIVNSTIIRDRNRILLAFLITGFTILFIVGLYTSYLYINIRQLMKGIIALSKGSYKRKIRLLKSPWTPYEVVFLASEFNTMGDEIYKSYKQLKQKNHELKELDRYRSNLIDTVSHEFRTPLTSIKGYTSRLLRADIELDQEMKTKSLKVIKRQVERLSAMVEDLLVIPDIEGARLKVNKEEVDVADAIETSVLSVSKYAQKEFIINCDKNISSVSADSNRLEQVLLNLFENASKYCWEDTPINIDVKEKNDKVFISVTNKADYISKDKLNKLFDKFTRMNTESNNPVSGTGLGLFIVKGLVESMGGSVKLASNKDNTFVATVTLTKFFVEDNQNEPLETKQT